MQPIAWRRPDLGLSSTNDVCRTKTWYHAPRQRDEVSMPRLEHRNHKTTWTSKAWFNQLFFEKKFVSHPPNRDTKSHVTRETQIANQQRSCTKQQSKKEATFPKKEECNVDLLVQVLIIVVKQPTSSHLSCSQLLGGVRTWA